MEKLSLILLSLAVGCAPTDSTDDDVIEGCRALSTEAPIAWDEPSHLGFSAADVVAALEGTRAVIAQEMDDGPAHPRSLTFHYTPGDEAHVEERAANEEVGLDCVVGAALAFDVVVEVTAEDGWLAATGPVSVLAQGVTPDQIWPLGDLVITPSPELSDAAHADAAKFAEVVPCTEDDVPLDLRVGDRISPWLEHVGTIGYQTCAIEARLYDLEPGDAP